MINIKKVVAFNENIIYPNCHICKEELSPYQVESGMSLTTLKLLELSNLILGTLNNKPVVLLCKKCIKTYKNKNEETT